MSGFKPPTISGSGTVTLPKCVKVDNGFLELNCPGCSATHKINLSKFSWNGSETLPTISQSIKVANFQGTICHCSLIEGKLHYHNDSKHHLAGQTIQVSN